MVHQYKVGDKVRIKKRQGKCNDYPYSFSDSMAYFYEGRILVIKEITSNYTCGDFNKSKKFYNGDDNRYIVNMEIKEIDLIHLILYFLIFMQISIII